PMIMTLIDDVPSRERIERLERLFPGRRTEPPAAALGELLCDPAPDDESASWIAAAALERVCSERLSELYPRVASLASESCDELVRETARWALAQTTGRRLAGAGGPF
ncbi:MAG TPA: hypothetical protein VMT85_24385, partial [Thermoanaerobaculia bacterium]|nr:hypothetical protein [Thermoanaerobaculia bacterium]